jgi:DHA1 family bicyclomycin/chloramphenicol resistance-like MFS transporter
MKALLSPRELTALSATLMAINAFCIDLMLPALPQLSDSLQVTQANDRQLVIVTYAMSSGIAQLIYGPLADAFGRRRVLLVALVIGSLGSVGCWAATSFPLLLLGRAVQGVAGASTRVIGTAVVRDMVSGPRMAQVLSTAMMIFLVVPIIAPSVGQAMLTVMSWRGLFAFLCFAFLALAAWCAWRLPETLPVERRVPLKLRSLLSAYGVVLRSPVTMGYTLVLTVVFAGMFAFLTSAQQLGMEVFKLGVNFPIAFAFSGMTLAAAQLVNSKLVMRLGTRLLATRAALGFAAINLLHALTLALLGGESLAVFGTFLLSSLFVFGFLGPNFNAMLMEPVGHVAGSAAALCGFVTTVGGAVVGGLVGHAYDGTTRPFVYGQAILGVIALALLMGTERRRRAREG